MNMIWHAVYVQRFTVQFAKNTAHIRKDLLASIMREVWDSILSAENDVEYQSGICVTQESVLLLKG